MRIRSYGEVVGRLIQDLVPLFYRAEKPSRGFEHQETLQNPQHQRTFSSSYYFAYRRARCLPDTWFYASHSSSQGSFHRSTDVAGGATWQDSRFLRFFVMQTFSIIFEGIFRWAQSRPRLPGCLSRGKRGVGVVWLVFWLFWTIPD